MNRNGGAGEVVMLVLSWVITTALTFVVVRLDERRLSEEKLERAWPASSRDAAIVAFGLLALPFHFGKTRGHLRSVRGLLGYPLGFLLGIAALLLVAFVSGMVLEGIAWAFGLPTE